MEVWRAISNSPFLHSFLGYTFFNVGLFYVDSIKRAYFRKHPGATDPVEANDVFFAIHAVVLTLVVIVQILIYEVGYGDCHCANSHNTPFLFPPARRAARELH